MENKNQVTPQPSPHINTGQPNQPQPQPVPTQPLVAASNSGVFEPQIITPSNTAALAPASDPLSPSPESIAPQVVNSPQVAPTPSITQPDLAKSISTPIASSPTQNIQPLDPLQAIEQPVVMVSDTNLEPPMSGDYNNPITPINSPKRSKKTFIIAGLAVFTLLLIPIFTFAFYIPNTPKHVWSSGLNNTGKETDKIIEKLQDPKAYKLLEKNNILFKGAVASEGTDIKLSFDSKYDSTKSNSNVDVSGKGDGKSYKINAQVKTILPDSATFPNIYFKISGLSSLGLDEILGSVKKYDNTWIAVEQDYYNSVLDNKKATDKQDNKNITQQDIISILSDLNLVAKEYVFTSDPNKAVVEMVSFVGKEPSEGIKANHYKAKINKDHAVAYCKATTEKLFSNKSLKRIAGTSDATYQQTKKDSLNSCETDIKNFDIAKTYDVWVDTKYKLMHKVRFYEDLAKANKQSESEKAQCVKDAESSGGNGSQDCKYYDDMIQKGERYYEYGQVFRGGSQINLFAHSSENVNGSKSDTRLDLAINTDKLQLAGKIAYTDKPKGGSQSKANFTILTNPQTGKIEAEKPVGAVPIQNVLNDFGLSQQ